jgi:hypothetical protein
VVVDGLQLLGVLLGHVGSVIFGRLKWPFGVVAALAVWDWGTLVPSSAASAVTLMSLMVGGLLITAWIAVLEFSISPSAGDDAVNRTREEERTETWYAQRSASRVRTLTRLTAAAVILHVPVTGAVTSTIGCGRLMGSVLAHSDESAEDQGGVVATAPFNCRLDEPLISFAGFTTRLGQFDFSALPFSATFALNGAFGDRWACDCFASRTFLVAYMPLALLTLLLFVIPLPVYIYFGIRATLPRLQALPSAIQLREDQRRKARAKQLATEAVSFLQQSTTSKRAAAPDAGG